MESSAPRCPVKGRMFCTEETGIRGVCATKHRGVCATSLQIWNPHKDTEGYLAKLLLGASKENKIGPYVRTPICTISPVACKPQARPASPGRAVGEGGGSAVGVLERATAAAATDRFGVASNGVSGPLGEGPAGVRLIKARLPLRVKPCNGHSSSRSEPSLTHTNTSPWHIYTIIHKNR